MCPFLVWSKLTLIIGPMVVNVNFHIPRSCPRLYSECFLKTIAFKNNCVRCDLETVYRKNIETKDYIVVTLDHLNRCHLVVDRIKTDVISD